MDTNVRDESTEYTEYTECLAAGPTMPEGFNDKNNTLIMNDANGSGGSAVVIASRSSGR